jgi:hypothetical protein
MNSRRGSIGEATKAEGTREERRGAGKSEIKQKRKEE